MSCFFTLNSFTSGPFCRKEVGANIKVRAVLLLYDAYLTHFPAGRGVCDTRRHLLYPVPTTAVEVRLLAPVPKRFKRYAPLRHARMIQGGLRCLTPLAVGNLLQK